MFERLGEIVLNNERYISDDDLPEIFVWFPMDKNYIGPGLLNESTEQKTERLIKLTKHVRTQLHRITSGLDATGEERLMEYLELRESVLDLENLLKECSQETTEKTEKAKNGVNEVKRTIEGLDFGKLVEEIYTENKFMAGIDQVLKPWFTDLEKEAFKNIDKPADFETARVHEKDAVRFAKEVRRANKVLTAMEQDAETQSNKRFAMDLIEDEKLRFRHIAQSAASRVENTRRIDAVPKKAWS